MTPREKAIQLMEKFGTHANATGYIGEFRHEILKDSSKQCALIAVDEIIASLESAVDYIEDSELYVLNTRIGYWQDVKTEINKL